MKPFSEEDIMEDVCEINIRQVAMEDQSGIVKLFQTFDKEKYKSLGVHNNNLDSGKTGLESLAGLRIDERGGIYLNPLLDTNLAYFKCYVAEDVHSSRLIGYILFFNTLDENRGGDEPVAVVEDLFVKPAFRGRGIATQLWNAVLKSSLDRGCHSCECILIPDSPDGIRFWSRRIGEYRIQSRLSQPRDRKHEVIVSLSQAEMRELYRRAQEEEFA